MKPLKSLLKIYLVNTLCVYACFIAGVTPAAAVCTDHIPVIAPLPNQDDLAANPLAKWHNLGLVNPGNTRFSLDIAADQDVGDVMTLVVLPALLSSTPANGTLQVDTTKQGAVIYKAPATLPTAQATDTFPFRVRDKHGATTSGKLVFWLTPKGVLSVRTVTLTSKLNCSNEPPAVVEKDGELLQKDAGAAFSIGAAMLASDPEGDLLTFSTQGFGTTAGGKLEVDPSKPGLLYTPPANVSTNPVEKYVLQATDGYSGLATGVVTAHAGAAGDVTIDVHECDRTSGLGHCLGQSWDGKWFSEKEERAGMVKSATGQPLALFVPNKAEYIRPTGKQDVIAIFPSPGSQESFWGCRPPDTVIWPTRITCNWSLSLRGGITYVMRLPVFNGSLLKTSLRFDAQNMFDTFGAYFIALSRNPATPILFNGTTPKSDAAGEPPAGCMTFGSKRTLVGGDGATGCPYLVPGNYDHAIPKQIMYLKIQAARSNAKGALSANCGRGTLMCRMYVNAW